MKNCPGISESNKNSWAEWFVCLPGQDVKKTKQERLSHHRNQSRTVKLLFDFDNHIFIRFRYNKMWSMLEAQPTSGAQKTTF